MVEVDLSGTVAVEAKPSHVPASPEESPDYTDHPRQEQYPNLLRGGTTYAPRSGRPRNVIRDALTANADEAVPQLTEQMWALFDGAGEAYTDGRYMDAKALTHEAHHIWESLVKAGMGEVKVTIDDAAMLRIVHGVLKARLDPSLLKPVMADLEEAVLRG